MFDRLRMLAAPEGDAGGGTSATDAGGDKGAGGDAAAAAAAAAAKKTADDAAAVAKEGERKSVLAGDKKGGEGDTGTKDTGAKAKDGAADGYVVKLPEGMKEGEVDKEQLSTFTKWAQEKKLTTDQATEALAFWKQTREAEAKTWAKQDQDWYGALEKDAEFGGANLKASEAALQTALKRFDTDGSLAKDLAKYGLENLPSLAKFIARVGKAGAEDQAHVEKDTKPGKKQSGVDRRKSFYDDMGDKPAEK